MCTFVTNAQDARFGDVLKLCDDGGIRLRVTHVADLIFAETLLKRRHRKSVTFRTLWAFCANARTVAIESDYFDIDYRSEVARLQEISFEPLYSGVTRLHFFGDTVTDGEHIRDFVKRADTYLGYIVMRSQDNGKIGRSLVTTHVKLHKMDFSGAARRDLRKYALGALDDIDISSRILTAVPESVQVFGVDRDVVGVPFMEQDGRLLRCAHVSAWACHYAAVLRRDVTRRPSGHFHSSALSTESVGRPFPSQGLTVPMLSSLLRTVDLPPENIDAWELMNPHRRKNEWYWSDSQRYLADVKAARKNGGRDALRKVWARYNLTATVARYVNSSIPLILASSSNEHTRVIVGYIRKSDLSIEPEGEEASAIGNPIVALIVSDDQKGPYRILSIDQIVDAIASVRDNIHLVVPLPRSLWMPGRIAEVFGVAWLREVVEGRIGATPEGDEALANLAKKMNSVGLLTVRTYMTTGTQFKRSVASRFTDPDVVRVIGQSQLPMYVWVVEVFERPVRSSDAEACAMIVFDPTTPVNADDVSDRDYRSSEPVIVYLPGHLYASQMSLPDGDEDPWVRTSVVTFVSGRSAASALARKGSGKSAVAGTTATWS